MIGLVCPDCFCSGCCATHRHYSDDISHEFITDWSETIHRSDRCTAVVIDSCTDASGNLYVVGQWIAGKSRKVQIQKWNVSGTKLWGTDIDIPRIDWTSAGSSVAVPFGAHNADVNPTPRLSICTDGTSVWLGVRPLAIMAAPNAGLGIRINPPDYGDPVYDNLWQLDCATGTGGWSANTGYAIYDVCPDGAGGVYTGILWADDGYLARYDSAGDKVGDNFGFCAPSTDISDSEGGRTFNPDDPPAIAARVISDGTNLYVAAGYLRASFELSGQVTSFDDLPTACECFPGGHVSKYNASTMELIWRWYRHESDDLEHWSGTGKSPTMGLAYSGGSLYVLYRRAWNGLEADWPGDARKAVLERWDASTAEVLWSRTFEDEKESPFAFSQDVFFDVATDGTHVWTASHRRLLKHDTAGNLLGCAGHGKTGKPGMGRRFYRTVAADGSGGVYAGGESASCETTDLIAACDQETDDCGEFCAENEPGEAGSTGGIVAVGCESSSSEGDAPTIPCTVPDVFDASVFGDQFPATVPYSWQYDQEFEQWEATFNLQCWEDDPIEYTVRLTAEQILDAVDSSGDPCAKWRVTYSIYIGTPDCLVQSGEAIVTDCWCDGNSDFPHPWFSWEFPESVTLDCYPEHCAADCTGGPHGVLSRSCPGERIPCTVPETIFGRGCFSEIDPINATWNYQGDWTWQLTANIPCGESNFFALTLVLSELETSSEGCQWLLYFSIVLMGPGGTNCNSPIEGYATITSCPCAEESDYGHPWPNWFADVEFGAECSCCDEGGGGNVPPGVEVACCENELPLTLTAEISNITNCSTIGGLATLTWNAGTSKWEGSIAQCDNTFNISFYCSGSDASGFRMDLDAGGDSPGECGLYTAVTPSGTPSCDPLIVEFRFFPGYNFCPCCQGGPVGSQGFKIIVTE